jgi:hypothetical protein
MPSDRGDTLDVEFHLIEGGHQMPLAAAGLWGRGYGES